MRASERALVTPLAAGISAARTAGLLNPPSAVGEDAVGRPERLAEQGVGADELLDHRGDGRVLDLIRHATEAAPLDQRGHAVLVLVGEPDPELQPERRRDLVVEEGPEALARDALHHLADQPPVGGGVVAVRGAGLPDGRLDLQRPDHRLPGQRLLEGEHGVDVRQTGLVAQEPPHGDVGLAGGLELGPVLGDRCIHVELAALGEQVGARRRGALGRREHQLERVLGVGRARVYGRPHRPRGPPPCGRRRRPLSRPPPRRAARSWRGTRPPPPRSRARLPPRSRSHRPPRPFGPGSHAARAACTPSRAERHGTAATGRRPRTAWAASCAISTTKNWATATPAMVAPAAVPWW